MWRRKPNVKLWSKEEARRQIWGENDEYPSAWVILEESGKQVGCDEGLILSSEA